MLSQLPRFFVLQLPAALYRLRWLTLAVALATFAVAALWAAWILGDPQVLANLGSDEQLQRLADEDFVDYYSENPAASFAGQVWTNNAWIAAQCIAFGITGVWVPYVVLQNAQNLGITAAVMFSYGEGDTFFLYIAPHGMLELTAIFVAAAAGCASSGPGWRRASGRGGRRSPRTPARSSPSRSASSSFSSSPASSRGSSPRSRGRGR